MSMLFYMASRAKNLFALNVTCKALRVIICILKSISVMPIKRLQTIGLLLVCTKSTVVSSISV